MRTVQLWWAGLCGAGTFVVALLAESNEAQCRTESGFLCASEGVAFGLVMAIGVEVRVVVAGVLWLALTLFGGSRS